VEALPALSFGDPVFVRGSFSYANRSLKAATPQNIRAWGLMLSMDLAMTELWALARTLQIKPTLQGGAGSRPFREAAQK